MRTAIRNGLLLLGATLMTFVSGVAHAVRPHSDHGSRSFQLASGEMIPGTRAVEQAAPTEHAPWLRFLEQSPGRWKASWDLATGVPLRVWGAGIAAPKSNDSAQAAERFSRAFIQEHVALLAPGSSANDFVLAANVLSGGVRSVGFYQRQDGLRVLDGQVSFRFKKDRLIAIGSEAFPRLEVEVLERPGNARPNQAAALDWIERDFGTRGRVENVAGPSIRALVRSNGQIVARRVFTITIRTRAPIARFEVDVDAATGEVFARRQTLMFASGEIQFHVPERHPGGARLNAPARSVGVLLNGDPGRTDHDGLVTWTSSGAATVQTSASGPFVRVLNDSGAGATSTLSLSDGGVATWDEAANQFGDAQLTAFFAATSARDYLLGVVPGFRFLQQRLDTYVNIQDEECNAFSDGVSIYFLVGGSNCENTARLPDVVRHEYGHSAHHAAVIPGVGQTDSSLGEGAADYLAATIINDSGMGRGFFYNDEPLRELDPLDAEAIWPRDQGEPHVTGLIYAGAMWDLRKHLIETYGFEQGVAKADSLWFGTLERASSITSAYVEVLVGDDDDGDLANGTPNICGITSVFQAHGLASATAAALEIGVVNRDGFRVEIPVTELGLCPGAELASATVVWELRGHAGVAGRIEMARNVGVLEATIPTQPEGEVLRYGVELLMSSGDKLVFPNNPADPLYEAFIGTVTPIYCTDFETDPGLEGWTHEMISGEGRRPRDEWEWGSLSESGARSGDPIAAFSGTSVIGNDIGVFAREQGFGGGSGAYQGNKLEQMLTHAIDLSGRGSSVRLQYRRWLTIEDGDFDQAEILANGVPVWSNHVSGTGEGEIHHIDREWRFHDVDLSAIASQSDGSLQVGFRLRSDPNLQLGGWTIDDFCIVEWDGPSVVCGDGSVQEGEACDDGNLLSGDGCQDDCSMTPPAVCGNGMPEAGEQCDDGNVTSGDGCDVDCTTTLVPVDDGLTTLQDADCSCRTGRKSDGTSPAFVALLLGLSLALRRRRR